MVQVERGFQADEGFRSDCADVAQALGALDKLKADRATLAEMGPVVAKAGQLAAGTDGVRRVTNNLQVKT